MASKKWRAKNKQDLIIEVWEQLDCESVGARELERIQQELQEQFGKGAIESPASIARTVADEGAVLRHPEILECDLKWRQNQLKATSLEIALDFSSLSGALQSFAHLEERRIQLDGKDGQAIQHLREMVSLAREESMLVARAKILETSRRSEAKEIAEWLTVWLQSPQLFRDWLDLRLRSPEFIKKFSKEN